MTAAILRFNARAFASVRTSHNYRLFFIGQTISLPGTWMQRIAQSWLVLTLTHSPFAVGILALCQFLPFTLFSLFAGVIVDRLEARRVVLVTQAIHMSLASIIAGITLGGVVEPWHVYTIAALMGCVQVLDAPARQQLTYRMVGRGALQNAVALNSSLFNASRIVGPALGGVLIGAGGTGFCFAFNAASYVAVLAGLLAMRPEQFFPEERHARPALLGGIKEGISYVRGSRDVLLVLVLVLVISTFCLNFNVLLPVLAKQTLHAGPGTLGLLSAFFGAGAVVGGVASAGQRRARRSVMVLGSAGFGLAELFLALDTTVWVACFLLLAAGISFTSWSSNSNSLVQLSAPGHLRGRVIGLYFFAFAGTGSVGGVVAGWLVTVGGTRLAFAVAGVAAVLASALVGRLLRGEAPRPERVVEPAGSRAAA